MKVNQLGLGVLKTNCYIIQSENKNAAAVDIGGESEVLLEFLEKNGLTLKKILLTHGHFDHIGGVEQVRKATGAEVYIHHLDAPKLSDCNENFGAAFGITDIEPVTEYNEISDGDIITLDEIQFRVMHTPGHTKGGVCYITDGVIFSGDTLFKNSMGRTDSPDGDDSEMIQSLKKLKMLEGDYTVYPGHNFSTTLNRERLNNPYMRSL